MATRESRRFIACGERWKRTLSAGSRAICRSSAEFFPIHHSLPVKPTRDIWSAFLKQAPPDPVATRKLLQLLLRFLRVLEHTTAKTHRTPKHNQFGSEWLGLSHFNNQACNTTSIFIVRFIAS